jgi:5-methylcytosine-specific restriction endonuclease McrA
MRYVPWRSRTPLVLPLDFRSFTYRVREYMTVNPLHCELSSWDGANNNCRFCNSILAPEQKRWCSGTCLQTWRLHHRYFLARQLAVKRSRRKCNCIRNKDESRHSSCARCGSCEAVVRLRGGIMTCDHIIPRRGDKSRFSCKHHQSNLQILCSDCHVEKSKEDEILYGI